MYGSGAKNTAFERLQWVRRLQAKTTQARLPPQTRVPTSNMSGQNTRSSGHITTPAGSDEISNTSGTRFARGSVVGSVTHNAGYLRNVLTKRRRILLKATRPTVIVHTGIALTGADRAREASI